MTAWNLIWHAVSTQRYRHPDDTEGAVAERFACGEVVLRNGTCLHPADTIQPNTDVFFYRRPAPEPPVPYEIETIFEDQTLLVVNKPPFLATIPRASHITENATVRMRRATGNEELSPAHRLDRMTKGLLIFTKTAGVRGIYQELFARRTVTKLYEAIADDVGIHAPQKWHHHIEKNEGALQARINPEKEPNALTFVDDVTPLPGTEGAARYLLRPVTGRTHQLRIQMHEAGVPIHGDPTYPVIEPLEQEDFSKPMKLAAVALLFDDPLSGEQRSFTAPGWSDLDIPPL